MDLWGETGAVFGGCMRPLFSLLLRCAFSLCTPGFVRLSQPLVSCFWLRLLIHTHPETYRQIFLVLLDAFSSRFFKTNVLFLYTLFSLLRVPSNFCFFCLARCSFWLFPNFRWDALWGIHSDVTLPYLKALVVHWSPWTSYLLCTSHSPLVICSAPVI